MLGDTTWINNDLSPRSAISLEATSKHTSNPEAFTDLSLNGNIKESHSVLTLFSSTQNENYLSITNKKAKTNKKGELEFEGDSIVSYIYLNSELTQNLKSILVKK